MNASRFDAWTRRRFAIAAGGALAAALQPPGIDVATAKKRKKKLQFNEFGCVNVGGRCRGKDDVCCSGICQGKKPKKGERDKSTCVAHDTGGCPIGHDACAALDIDCTTSAGSQGECATTTGNAGYCFNVAQLDGPCRRDADCQAALGAAAACIQCPSNGQTLCVGFQIN